MLRSLALLISALAAAPALHAQPATKGAVWTPAGPTACRFSGWTTNDKPAILVRAGASDSAKQVGVLPTTRGDSPDPQVDLYSVTFDVTEARDGWLRVRNASDAMSASDHSPARPVYRGEGWIAAADAQVGIQSARGYARPDAGSERLLDLGGDWLTERATLRGIVACDGDWLLLDYEMRNSATFERLAEKDRTRGRAWFRGVCASSETTCDMRSVDR